MFKKVVTKWATCCHQQSVQLWMNGSITHLPSQSQRDSKTYPKIFTPQFPSRTESITNPYCVPYVPQTQTHMLPNAIIGTKNKKKSAAGLFMLEKFQPPKITSPKVGASFHAAQGEVRFKLILKVFSLFISRV